jgi:predicted cupin superfamily sugar epimerase
MNAAELIEILHLQPHPREKGFYVETYRSKDLISWDALPGRYEGTRCLSTAIYFMLVDGGFSELHRLKSDEIFHFYLGAPAEMLLLHSNDEGEILRLGNNIQSGEEPQIVVPAGAWQGMRTTGDYSLFGCTVSPGFEYLDYESGKRDELVQQYPEFRDWILQLT